MRDQPLTSEIVNEMLERSRLEIEEKLANAGPFAVTALSDIVQDKKAKDADRINAAKAVLDKVYASPKSESAEDRGPTINVVINKLYAGERIELPIPVSERAMSAIEAGLGAATGQDFDGEP